ncbi:DUF3006 domain-containing protein [Oscillospiraceae bacterium OttesenSCG-928-F05]|nr:DUF3006 domain-containing protein [Oscillospiraceae bacterium OttesenSCG-928-F05]
MEQMLCTVIKIDGDYALLLSENGVENRVARALLPPEADDGSRLLSTGFSYELLPDHLDKP